MPTDPTPWAVILAFVAALGAVVIAMIRSMANGRIVAGRHYDDARKDEADWRALAQRLAETGHEQAGHIGRLTAAVEQLTATTRETQQLTRRMLDEVVLPHFPTDRRAS